MFYHFPSPWPRTFALLWFQHMELHYVYQPDAEFGRLLERLLGSEGGDPVEVILVSAWLSRQALLRIRERLLSLRNQGTTLRVVTGVDLGGTSREALEELLQWDIDARVVSDRRPRHVFHPKLSLVVRDLFADTLVGSNNFTDGGLYTNFEAAAHCQLSLPVDQPELDRFRAAFQPILDPAPPTGLRLTRELIETLAARGELPTESQRSSDRETDRRRRSERGAGPIPPSPFGTSVFVTPPPLPAAVVHAFAREADRRRPGVPAPSPPGDALSSIQLNPVSFYMTLAAIGRGIPGEQRIPLAARDIALDFWEWNGSYQELIGRRRAYFEWRPTWRVRLAGAATPAWEGPVRMYYYPASHDFRFHSGELLRLGAQAGDVVRITKVEVDPAVYECDLARQGTAEYAEWIRYCSQPVQNSLRRWGYA